MYTFVVVVVVVVVVDDDDDDDDIFICRNHLVIISVFIYTKEAHAPFCGALQGAASSAGSLFINKEQINVGL